MLNRLAAFVCALIMLAAVQPAVALDIDVSEFKLGNGLRVVVIPSSRAPVVTHMIWYRVGAADEPPGKAGIAHFLEHLMFKGTTRYPEGEFSRLVRINGGEENAFTTQDYTAYFQRIAKDRLDMVMGLEADRMQNLVLTEAMVEPELKVVLEERRERIDSDPSSLFSEQMNVSLYAVHPYRKPVIGWMDEVSRLTLQDAMDFYRAHYEPANAVVIIAGDVTVEDARRLAEKHYGPLKNLHEASPAARAVEPAAIAERRMIMRDGRVSTPTWRRTYLAPAAGNIGLRSDLAHQIMASALGGGSQSRLHQKIVLEQKLATYAGAWYSGDSRDLGTFGVYAAPNPGVSMAQLESAIDEVLAEMARTGLTQQELDATRNRLEGQTAYLLDSQDALARAFGTSLMTGQTVNDLLNWDKVLADVSLEDAAKAARGVIDRKASVTGILLPEGTP